MNIEVAQVLEIIPNQRTLGQAIRLARRSKGLTQAQLARLAGTVQSAVSDTERGESFEYKNVARMARSLGMKTSQLFQAAEALQEADSKVRELYAGVNKLLGLTEPDEMKELFRKARRD